MWACADLEAWASTHFVVRRRSVGKGSRRSDTAEVIEIIDQDLDNMLDFATTRLPIRTTSTAAGNDLKRNPARFPRQVPEFFIKFLTDENDFVVDPSPGAT